MKIGIENNIKIIVDVVMCFQKVCESKVDVTGFGL